jgi:hypothetical protein
MSQSIWLGNIRLALKSGTQSRAKKQANILGRYTEGKVTKQSQRKPRTLQKTMK